MMSLQNLGKVSGAVNFINSVANNKRQKVEDTIASAKLFIGNMEIDDAVKALSSLGIDKDAMPSFLKYMGYDAIKAADAISKLNTESSNLGNTFKRIGTKLGDIRKGIGSVLTPILTNPATWAAVATAAVIAAPAIYEYANSFGVLSEKAEEAKVTLDETTSEIEQLKSQRDANVEKISTLSETAESASVNAATIKQLERENALLETQIAVKERLRQSEEAEAAKSANRALTSVRGYLGEMQMEDGDAPLYTTEYMDIIEKTKSDLEDLADLERQYDSLSDSSSENYIQDVEKRLKAQERLQSQIDELSNTIDNNKLSIVSLYDSLHDSQTGEVIKGYELTVDRINELFPELADGTLLLSEKAQQIQQAFKQALLDGNTDVTAAEELSAEVGDWLRTLNTSDQEYVYDIYFNPNNSINTLEDLKTAYADFQELISGSSSDLPIDIEAERTGIDSMTSAINESASATGLASETVETLKDRYADLEGFDASALFTETATGIRLNSRELTRLEQQYEAANKQNINDYLSDLSEQYDELTEQIEKYKDTAAEDDYRARRDAIEDQIASVKALAAEYNGLTSAYAEWVNAQSATQAGAWYDSAKEGLDSLKELYKSGDYGNTALQEGLEYFTGANITGIDNWHDRMHAIDAAYKQLDTTIVGTKYSINDFMAGGQVRKGYSNS